ncbi:MAG: hypothetical protein PW789_04705 [Edaphobacter sp.]|uniref:hypothetical protein n=1 Tax=Edaphobacter sp. TaxID=1934404 RepID=UPI00238BB5F6|nr:hypothetical protein [Edaphobacter sp.]MDE1175887.1 hypothetical protein [Edaphobacter sp.]
MVPRILLFFAVVLTPIAAVAQGARVSSPVELARIADGLKPGEWVWASQRRTLRPRPHLRRPLPPARHRLPQRHPHRRLHHLLR